MPGFQHYVFIRTRISVFRFKNTQELRASVRIP